MEKRSIFRFKKSKILLSISFLLAINLLLYAFFKVDLNKNIIRAFCAFLCVLYLFLTKKIDKPGFILLVIAAYLIVINGNVSINMAFMIILSVPLATCQREELVDNYNKVHVFMLLVIVLSLATGVVKNVNWTYMGRTRNSLGFSHVNYAGLLLFSTVSMFLLSRKEIKWYAVVGSVIVSAVIFYYSDSRTGFVGTILFIVFLILFHVIPEKMLKYIAAIIITLFFLSPLIWKLPIMNNAIINRLFSTRPGLFLNYIQKNSMINLLFGGSRAGEIDNAFLMLVFNCGLPIYLGTFGAVLQSALNKIERKKRTEVAFIVAALSVGVMESSLIRPELPCMVFFWTTVISDVKPSLKKVLKGSQS